MNNICRFFIIAVGVSISAASGYLTFQFLDPMSHSLGVVGILMEVVKFGAPILAGISFSKRLYVRFSVLSIVTLALCSVSFLASYAAVQNGFTADVKNSSEYSSLSQQIELKRQVMASMPSKWITKRAAAADELAELIKEQANVSPVSGVYAYQREISLAIALIVELLGVATAVALSVMSEDDNGQNGVNEPLQKSSAPVLNSPEEDFRTFHAHDAGEVLPISVAHIDVEDKIRAGIIEKRFDRPSIAGVRKLMRGISNDRISAVLSECHKNGYLIKRGKVGYKYA
ncbi:hypothetical protein [Vibrio parahaemolyticus]|uniref:hypothetical protein n=1 Tax=Vibrio parahaemolyticus TaxID=670 RepID=UPI00226B149D|nr:hypothetical protein [Vibrio parahaemolyticus]MCX8941287.1 hypothetical protein [Vibrio parahaemolyticus]